MKKLMQLMIALAVIAPLVLAFAYRHNKTRIIEQVAVHEVEKQLPEVREIPLSIPTPPVVTEEPTPAPTFSERVKNIFRKKPKQRTTHGPVVRGPVVRHKPAPAVPADVPVVPVVPAEPPVVTRLNCLFPFSLIPGCYVQVF